MAQFTVKQVVGGGTFVAGTDDDGRFGQTVLYSAAWDAYVEYRKHIAKHDAVDAAAKEFFAPLMEALAATAEPDKKDWSRIVISEGVDGTEAEGITLDQEGIVLRILDETDGSSLRWVGTDVLIPLED